LKIGDKVLVSDLATGEFKILHPENTVVVQVRVSRLSVAAPGEDEDDEDETEGAEGEGEAAAAAEGAPASE
jgi:large subunit ribosomal protein L25